MQTEHEKWMQLALAEAQKAEQKNEVPIGALIVDAAGNSVAAAHNQVITLADPTAHAEILALRAAGHRAGNYRLPGTTLYVTVEPCPMCMGAAIHARVKRLVFGAFDARWGAAVSLYNLAADRRLNHQVEIISGVLEVPCRRLMQDFFRRRRG